MPNLIAIVDYDVGNVAAVANMLKRLGHRAAVTANPDEIREADRLILPGNGSFDACMGNLKASGLIPLLEERVLGDGVPLLGICVGAQMLGVCSMEGRESGLGWVDVESVRFSESLRLPIPHMGWAPVRRGDAGNQLVKDLDDGARFYFVHSYYLAPKKVDDAMLWSHYGSPFVAGVAQKNVFGVQFHPEKSHRYGKILLDSFARIEA